MTEVQIDTEWYQIGQIDARKQFHVARRLAPLLFATGEGFAQAKQIVPDAPDVDLSKFNQLLEAVAPKFTAALAKMADDDVDYVLDACLPVIKRKQGASWAPIVNSRGQLMFADMSMPLMTRLAVEAIKENLGGFFSGGAALS